MDDYLGEFLFDIIFYPGMNLPPTLSLGLHPLCGGRDLLFLLSPPPPLVSALTRKPLLGFFPNICSMHTVGPGEFFW